MQVSGKTKLIALPHVSNMLGCVLPVAQVVEVAEQHGAKVLLDACQSVPHMPVDVQVRTSPANPHTHTHWPVNLARCLWTLPFEAGTRSTYYFYFVLLWSVNADIAVQFRTTQHA